jgi:8-oxo-dGTP pyrophosphatase MutT (NUDIX family)
VKKWKLIKETDVSPSKWFPVMRHTVELPDGTIIDDYFISPLGDVVMVLPVTVNNEIVLVRQYKHAVGEILIELPAGFRQPGKTLEESALAELEEETGIRTGTDNLVYLGKTANNPTKTTNITHAYLERNLEFNSRQHFDNTEHIEIFKAAPKVALAMAISGKILVADSVATILKAAHIFPEIFA